MWFSNINLTIKIYCSSLLLINFPIRNLSGFFFIISIFFYKTFFITFSITFIIFLCIFVIFYFNINLGKIFINIKLYKQMSLLLIDSKI